MKRASDSELIKFVNGGWMNFVHTKQRKVVMLNTSNLDGFTASEPIEWIVTNYCAGMICLFGGCENAFVSNMLRKRKFIGLLFVAHHIFVEDDGEMKVIKTRDYYNWPNGMSWLESEEEMQLHAEIAGMKPVLIDPISKEIVHYGFF